MRIGAHVRGGSSASGGILDECHHLGADAAQVFISNPRGWAGPRVTDEVVAAYAGLRAGGVGLISAHAPYLVNIASPKDEFLEKSRSLAATTAEACSSLGVDTLVLHAGAGGPGEATEALARAVETLRVATDHADPSTVKVLVELMAGTKGAVASTLEEAEKLLDAAGDLPVGICLDTCHLFAAGYALDTPEGNDEFFDELNRRGLTSKVGLVHANDSKFARGEKRDRHENIGDGHMGLKGFAAFISHPEAADWTLVLETPGGPERWAADIATLKGMVTNR